MNDPRLPQHSHTVDCLAQSWDLHALLTHIEKTYIELRAAASAAGHLDEFGSLSEAADYLLTARCAVDDAVNAVEVK